MKVQKCDQQNVLESKVKVFNTFYYFMIRKVHWIMFLQFRCTIYFSMYLTGKHGGG